MDTVRYAAQGWWLDCVHAWREALGWWHGLVLPGWHSPWLSAFEWGVFTLGVMCAAISLAWVWKRVR